MTDRSIMNAAPHNGIAFGSCIIVENNKIAYAGPLKGSPYSGGRLVLLNPDDYKAFKAHVENKAPLKNE